MAPNHYLNQCRFIIRGDRWYQVIMLSTGKIRLNMSHIKQRPHLSMDNELSDERRNRATDLLYNVGRIGVSIARLD